MARPTRYYAHVLAERLGKYPREILSEMSSADIAEFMAFDQLQDKDCREKIKGLSMSEEERNAALMRLLGGA